MKIVNIFSGPGAGKSTLAAGLFYQMKCMRLNCELVQEYAKDLVWEQRQNILTDQIYVFAKQQRRIRRLQDHKIDWVITDSPIPMGLVYVQPGSLGNSFNELVWETHHQFTNINFFLTRAVVYSEVGRNQTESQAQMLDQQILDLLKQSGEPYQMIQGGDGSIDQVLHHLGLTQHTPLDTITSRSQS